MNPLSQTHQALADPDLKRAYNRALFREVAPRYDLVTRILSFGRDAAWKSWLLRQLPETGIHQALDLACGTGDITRALAEKYPDAEVTGLDLTPEMLALARSLSPEGPHFVQGDMMRTGKLSESCDLITGGYALRNAPDLQAALCEIHRLLRPGATAAFLDFSAPAHPLLRKCHYALLWFWGALWGLLLHGDPRVYAYIARSLAHFPDRRTLHEQMKKQQLPVVQSRRFMFGMIEGIVCRKPLQG